MDRPLRGCLEAIVETQSKMNGGTSADQAAVDDHDSDGSVDFGGDTAVDSSERPRVQ